MRGGRWDDPNWLDGHPDDPGDDGDHRECGTNESHVGHGASDATAPAGLTAKVPGSLDKATLRGGPAYTGGRLRLGHFVAFRTSLLAGIAMGAGHAGFRFRR
jgi:hypothetical protein